MSGIIFHEDITRDLLVFNSEKIFVLPTIIFGEKNKGLYGILSGMPNAYWLPVRRSFAPSMNNVTPFFTDQIDERPIVMKAMRNLYRHSIKRDLSIAVPFDLLDSEFAQLATYSPKLSEELRTVFSEHFGVSITGQPKTELFNF